VLVENPSTDVFSDCEDEDNPLDAIDSIESDTIVDTTGRAMGGILMNLLNTAMPNGHQYVIKVNKTYKAYDAYINDNGTRKKFSNICPNPTGDLIISL
jgi:hypothetical protein